jgi:hypothetical protein
MQLEDLRFQMEMANYRLQFQLLQANGLLTIEQIDLINGLLADIDAAYAAGGLDFQLPNIHQGGGGGGNRDRDDELARAMDRLRNAIENLREFQEGLTTSELSPLTIEQQYAEAMAQYQSVLDAAMSGDVEAIENLPGAAQTLLELAQQMFDPSGAGYASIFQMIQDQIEAVLGVGQGILNGNPVNPNEGVEDRLDGIYDVLVDIREAQFELVNWPQTAPPGRLGEQNGPQQGPNGAVVVHDAQNASSLRRIERRLETANVLQYDRARAERASSFKRESKIQTGYVGGRVNNRMAS